ncbi:hypothetical protein [Endozoicomonas sp. YOMI1]|uniref:hypothetical protein n=1 Tax=Endozoicomonas sp. YOMI1 TaxID=2828739 RepID=UPI002147A95A|nr:hypothetical protein [Endozoicomonas sp. YOMI1]
MIFPAHYVNSQQTTGAPVTKQDSASTASADIKFGDTFRAIRPVFDEKILQNANEAINADSGYFVDESRRPRLQSRLCSKVLKGDGDSQYILDLIPDERETKVNVKFDCRCRIVDRKKFRHQLVTSNEALIELAIKGVEVLARQFSLKGESMEMFRLSIIRNYISDKGLRGGGWHRDYGEYTLVMLMNDDSVIKKNAPYYTGGGLDTAKCAGESWFTGAFPVEGTSEGHFYEKNGGFVFSNTGELLHQGADAEYVSVNPGESQEEPLEKRLLLIIMSHSPQSEITPERKHNLSDLFSRVKSWFVS